MKMIKKITKAVKYGATTLPLMLFVEAVHATDLLGDALGGDIADSLGGSSKFWKIFILIDIMLATALAVKTKNPMVFLGVAAVAFIPTFLIKTFVF